MVGLTKGCICVKSEVELLGLALGQPNPIKPFKLSFGVQLIVGTMLYLDLGPILEDWSGSYMLVVIQKSIYQKQKRSSSSWF